MMRRVQGGKGTLSKSVERTVEKKMRGKRRRSSRVIARELKNTEGCRRELLDRGQCTAETCTHSDSVKPRACQKPTKRGRLRFAKANTKKDWNNVVFSDEHTFKQFKGGNPRHNFVWAKSVSEVPGKEMERWGLTVDAWGGFSSQETN